MFRIFLIIGMRMCLLEETLMLPQGGKKGVDQQMNGGNTNKKKDLISYATLPVDFYRGYFST